MNNEPVAWYWEEKQIVDLKRGSGKLDKVFGTPIPLYTHPATPQLNNGHLSDCAIHNEPASRNKDCDCGFEPKFNLADLKHEDNCRYFDDGVFCTCGADTYALVEWYRHKELPHPSEHHLGLAESIIKQQELRIAELNKLMNFWKESYNELRTHPAKTLTDEEIQDLIDYVAEKPTDEDLYDFAKAILRKVQEK
jgi:hypothetical protein